MLTREENELLTRVGPGTPMGELMRRYWFPSLLSEELPEPGGDPKRGRLLGEGLGAYRAGDGRGGTARGGRPPRGACPAHRPGRARRTAVCDACTTAGRSAWTAACWRRPRSRPRVPSGIV